MRILEFLGLKPRKVGQQKAQRWMIVSNRLPFRWDTELRTLEKSAGGLVSAISAIHTSTPIVWFGAAPEGISETEWKTLHSDTDLQSYKAIFFDPLKYNNYYNGMCNSVLWPLLHYEGGLLNFSEENWQAYKEVNQSIAQGIAQVARPDDVIWVHDFHLMLLPLYLRRLEVKQAIGFFLHTPFPSAEVFRQLPVRAEVLRGLLAADLVGFHDHSYLRYFSDAVWNVLGVESANLTVETEAGVCNLGVFPVSIDTAVVRTQAAGSEVADLSDQLSQKTSTKYRILGVDRLDYIKGLKLKFKAYRHLLQKRPDLVGQVTLTQIVVPSRLDVPGISELKAELEQMVGEINGVFGRPGYVPLEYIFSSVSQEQLLAFYRSSQVLLVTSRRDGMNLVALEYVAAQNEINPGVLVLSEFTGATSALSEALSVNPWDSAGTAAVIERALDLSQEERVRKHSLMMSFLSEYTASTWAGMFVESLEELRTGSLEEDPTKLLLMRRADQPELKELAKNLSGKKVVVFCDYDGTLAGYHLDPEQALLDAASKAALLKLCRRDRTTLIVTSGRDQNFLKKNLQDLGIDFAAEHGCEFYSSSSGELTTRVAPLNPDIIKAVKHVLKHYSIRVPGSFVEEKHFGLVWHYRRGSPEFAELQARKLRAELESYLANEKVRVARGKKVIEIVALESDKGAFVDWYMKNRPDLSDAVLLALGDDFPDEVMFEAVKKAGGKAIKIGAGTTNADYRLRSHKHAVEFLEWLAAL